MPLVTKNEEHDPLIAQAVEAVVAAYHVSMTLAERPDQYGSASLEAMAHASTTALDQALQSLGYTPARIRKLVKDYGQGWHDTRAHVGNAKWSAGGDFAQDHPANVRYLRSRLRELAPSDPGRAPTVGGELRARIDLARATHRKRERPPEDVEMDEFEDAPRSGLPQPRARARSLPIIPPEPKSPPAATPAPALTLPQPQARHRVRPPARPAANR